MTTKIELVLGVISMYFRVFSEGKCTEREYFCEAKISNILGVLDIPDIILQQTVEAGPNPTYEEKVRVPSPSPPPPPPTNTHSPWVTVYDEKLLDG